MRLRSLVILLVAAAVLIAVAASGYWVWWAGQLERGLAQWREAQRLRGYEIEYGSPDISGFPLAHRARFAEPWLRTPDGLAWHGSDMSAEAPLWDPRRITFDYSGRHRVERPGPGGVEAVMLDSREAVGTVRLGPGGRLEQFEATVEGSEVLAEPLGRFSSALLRLSLDLDYDGSSGAPLGADFAYEAAGLELPPALAGALGPRAEKVLAVGRLNGVPTGSEPRLALAHWRDTGGAVDLDQVEVEWWPIAVSASGRLTLDDQLRTQGQLTARIAGLPELLDRLAGAGHMTAQQAANIKLGMRAFSGEPDEKGRPVLAVPVILSGGLLSLGPLPLARLSPVL